jgi:hypothetical protein
MGYHEVNMSGFVHRVAAIFFKIRAYALLMGDKPPVLTVGRKIFLRRLVRGQGHGYPGGR